jgi:hypothetical protein
VTRKRAVKLLMARGYSRNHANGLMRNKAPGNSNFQAYNAYLRCERICDAFDRLSGCFYNYGASADVLAKALFSFGKSLTGR